jgi:DNA-binding CsgD family transcriptional regulator
VTTRLRESDYQAILEFLREAETVDGDDPFPVPVIQGLANLIPCEQANFSEIDRVNRRIVSHTDTTGERFELDPTSPAEQTFWRIVVQMPICAYQLRTGCFEARTIFDFLSRRQLHQLEWYTDYLHPDGIEDQMIAGIGTPALTRNFLFHRGQEFTERDRLVLDLLRPHLAHLDSSAMTRRRADAAVAALDAVGGDGREIVALAPNGRIEFATAGAHRLLAKYFDGPASSSAPEVLTAWLQHERTHLNGDRALAKPGRPLTRERAGRHLVIRLARREHDPTLLLLEERELPADADALGLTPREHGVLALVEKGKSNAEIARELWITTRTVRKHLEHVYTKLGVNSRTAAAVRLRDDASS